MAADISVKEDPKQNPPIYVVAVREGRSETRHSVTVENSYRERLAGSEIAATELVRKSFEFLLKREPKEAILRQFDLRVISRYFPEYENEMRRIFSGGGNKS